MNTSHYITPNGIARGHRVRDITTGLTGTAYYINTMLNGSIQVGIQPPLKDDGTLPTIEGTDWQVVEKVDEGVADKLNAVDDLLPIKLGDEVVDNVSGFRGMATERIVYQNGCISYAVTPKTDFSERGPKPTWFDQHRLTVQPAANAAPATQSARGGGAARVSGLPRSR